MRTAAPFWLARVARVSVALALCVGSIGARAQYPSATDSTSDPAADPTAAQSSPDNSSPSYPQATPYDPNASGAGYNAPYGTNGVGTGGYGTNGYGPQGPLNGGTGQGNGTTERNPNGIGVRQGAPGQQTQVFPRASTRRVAPEPPTQFQRVIEETTGQRVPIFGADMFRTVPSTFAPVDNIPVTPEYVIGPGDEIRLQVWGQVNLRGSYIVDRTGAISIPQVGTLQVAGLQYAQLADFLRSHLARVYRNFDLNVNLGQLRSIQVFVVGRVRQPGSYTIGSLSTLLNALFASGGPLPMGSLRNIELRRGGKTVVNFDMYDLVLHGDKSKDVVLEPGDVIFVPDVGPQVAVLGSVKVPAIYELRDETTYQQVVALAGGETNVAAATGARVERVFDHKERDVQDLDLRSGTSPKPQNGDVLILNSIVERFRDTVTLRGNVANPGRYAWHPGMRISDLIPNQESLVTRDYYRRQDRLGQATLDYLGPVQPASAQQGQLGTGMLQTEDGVMQNQVAGPNGVPMGRQINGTGEQPAQRTSSGIGAGGTPAGAALTAGNNGFAPRTAVTLSAPDIDWEYAVIERQNTQTLTTSLLPFNLGKVVMDKDPSQNLELLSGDVVTVFSKADIRVPNAQQTKFVKLEGEFVAAGVYSVQPGETLRHLLQRAGGFTPEAYLYGSEFTRVSVRRLQKQRLMDYADSLESSISVQTSSAVNAAVTDRDAAAAQASAAAARDQLARLRQVEPSGRIVLQLSPDSRGINAVPDLDLEDGDEFLVPRIPTSVNVVGQVYSPNSFVYQPNRKVRDYLQLAGGPDRAADAKREFVVRADGSVVSHQYANARHFGDFNHIAMLPGDTIVVPPRVIKGNLLRDLANIGAILSGFGIAVAAVNVLP